jgi:chromosome segregation ATPase
MLSRLLHIGVDKRLERAAWKIAELETLQSRIAEIESSLKARADAELVLLHRLTDCHVKFELTRQRLGNLTAQVSDSEVSSQRERDRADSYSEALAALERRLADMTSGRAELHAELEKEHALRVIAEQAVQRLQMRDAEMEERLRRLTEGLELGVSKLSKMLAARRDSYERMVASLTQLAERLNPLLERAAAPPQAAAAPSPAHREDEHLRFYMNGSGYELTVVEGPPPQTHAVVNGAEHGSGVVMKLGRSPLPGDRRCCAYLLPIEAAAAPGARRP